MVYQLTYPDHLILQGPDGMIWRGASQDWYTTAWQRRAGCAPTTAATMLAYLGKTRPELSALVPELDAFLPYMESVWEYVTPGPQGLDDPEGFLLGCRSFALSRQCVLQGEVLEIPADRSLRPNLARCRAFLTAALEADLPVAFLNYSSEGLAELDDWHWVPVVSLRGKKTGLPCTYLDGGREEELDFDLWLKNTKLGGALVRVDPEPAW